jgi:hypothetical protein
VAHRTIRSGYQQLVTRLNRFPQGAPPSDVLYGILKMLFSEREAGLVALLPIKPFSVQRAAQAWKMDPAGAQRVLDELAGRAILLDVMGTQGQQLYMLPPPMAGFFEFSMMRIRGDIDQKVLSELFYQYMNVEEEFIKTLFTHGETQLGRVFVQEAALSRDNALHVLDYERASEVVKNATQRGISLCYCRHKMDHLGRACDAPMKICMTFGGVAASLIKHGFAREADVAEGLDLLQQAQDHNLVQFGENVRHDVAFICNCCGCCCEAMIAARRFGWLHPVHTSLRLEYRPERVITPLDSTHRTVVMAIERGMLQDLIFDNQALVSHRAMAAILGVILKLPPVKQSLASQQMRSRYLESLLVWGKQRYSPS